MLLEDINAAIAKLGNGTNVVPIANTAQDAAVARIDLNNPDLEGYCKPDEDGTVCIVIGGGPDQTYKPTCIVHSVGDDEYRIAMSKAA